MTPKLKQAQGSLLHIADHNVFDPPRGFSLHTDAIVVQFFLNAILFVIIVTDIFQPISHVPPVLTYLVFPIFIFIVGWALYFWPSSHNWRLQSMFSRTKAYNVKSWVFFEAVFSWLIALVFSIVVFSIVGFTFWPAATDAGETVDLFYDLVSFNFGIYLFKLHNLYYPFWADLVNSNVPV